jgi:hypothetical protein
MRFDKKARLERLLARIGRHLRAVEVQLLSPHQPVLLALLHDLFKKAPEDVDSIAHANARQA